MRVGAKSGRPWEERSKPIIAPTNKAASNPTAMIWSDWLVSRTYQEQTGGTSHNSARSRIGQHGRILALTESARDPGPKPILTPTKSGRAVIPTLASTADRHHTVGTAREARPADVPSCPFILS